MWSIRVLFRVRTKLESRETNERSQIFLYEWVLEARNIYGRSVLRK